MQKMNLPEKKEYYIAYFDILGYKDFFGHASKETIRNTILMICDGIIRHVLYPEKSLDCV